MFQSSPVQCSRSNLTTCLRKGCLLRFQLNSTSTSELIRRLSSNSTATSDCGAQTISGMMFNLSLRSIALLNLSIIHYLYSPSQPHRGDHACFGATSTHADLPHLIRGGGEGGFWSKVLNVVGTSDLAWRPVIDSPWKAVIYWVNVCAWVTAVPAVQQNKLTLTKPEKFVV